MPTKYRTIYIGIDQSYSNTGVSVICDGKVRDIKHIKLSQYKCNSDKRNGLRVFLDRLLTLVTKLSNNITIICERARLHGGPNSYINLSAISTMAALTAVIVDTAHKYDIPVYSVDTRCWKAQVVGTSKPAPNDYGVPPEKWPTVQYVNSLGFQHKIRIALPDSTRKRKGTYVHNGIRYMYDNDMADATCIGLYGVLGDKTKLHLET